MKIITLPQYEGIIASIIHDAEETAKLKHETFNGVSDKEILAQITKRIGSDWMLTKDTFKFDPTDVDAVARERFFRKTGVKLIALLMGVMVILYTLMTTFAMMRVIIPLYIEEGVIGIVAMVILYIYFSKLKKAREELRKQVYHK